jgi:hypothetical protein
MHTLLWILLIGAGVVLLLGLVVAILVIIAYTTIFTEIFSALVNRN